MTTMHVAATGEASSSRSEGLPFNATYLAGAVAALDFVAMGAAFLLSYSQAHYVTADLAKIWKITDAAFCASILYLMVATAAYRPATLGNPFSQVSRILLNSLIIAGLEWGALWSMDLTDKFKWPWFGPINFVSAGVVVMCMTRFVVHQALVAGAQRGKIGRSVAIVGAGRHGQQLMDALTQRREPWTRIIGVFDDRRDRLRLAGGDLKINGAIDDLITYSRDHRVDEILVALPWGAEDRLLSILSRLKVIPANVHLAPDAIGHHFLDRGFERLDGVPIYSIYAKPMGEWGGLVKRVEDLVFGSMIMVLAAPVMLACAIAVRLDSRGPILFRQYRYGYNNKLIGIYKFRSMYHELRDENASKLVTQGDPRITRVGRILRRTSLDELPQLFNVLVGQMSLVGPRPHATQAKAAGKLYQEVVQEYAVRHKVKPGITGWAQVNGWRGETDTEEKILRRVEFDLYYMENWSVFLDIEILFRTAWSPAGKNAY